MVNITLKAPTLFDAAATAEECNTVYHDAPETGQALAQRKRFAQWLKTEIIKHGLAAEGPTEDEGGWIITVPLAKRGLRLFASKRSGFVLVMVTIERWRKDDTLDVCSSPIGSAVEEHEQVEQVLEKIMRNSPAIGELDIRP